MASNREREAAEELRELAQMRSPAMDAALPTIPIPSGHGSSPTWKDIRAVFRQTPDSDRTEAMWSKRRIFEFLDASTTKNLDRIKDKEAAIKLLSEVDAWENDHAAPEDKRKRSKCKRKERKQAEKALTKMERQAGEMAVDEAAMQVERGRGENWLGKQDEPMGTGKGKEKGMTAIEGSC